VQESAIQRLGRIALAVAVDHRAQGPVGFFKREVAVWNMLNELVIAVAVEK
jgi:hypothetical protein